MSRGFDGFEIDDFRDSGSDSGRDVGRSSSSDWNARTNFTTSTGRKIGPTDSTARGGNVRAENARRWHVKNASKQSSLSALEPSTRIGTKTIPCEIPRFIRSRKLASSAS